MTKEELFELTAIDPWWLAQLEELHNVEVCEPTHISGLDQYMHIAHTSYVVHIYYTYLAHQIHI